MTMRMSRPAAVVVALALAVAGCGKAFGGRVVYQGDYPSYQSAAELLAKATLVIEATPARPRVDKLYPSGGSRDQDTGIVITVYAATVTKVHKGDRKPGDVVDVQQMGGLFDGVSYEQEGGVPFRQGTTYLLFLETFPDAPAALLNPTQAQYEVALDGSYRTVTDANTITVHGDDL